MLLTPKLFKFANSSNGSMAKKEEKKEQDFLTVKISLLCHLQLTKYTTSHVLEEGHFGFISYLFFWEAVEEVG